MSVFVNHYATNHWNGTDSLSGPGSSRVTTQHVVSALNLIERAIEPLSVLNVACGDDLWTPELPGYLGVDIVPQALERARGFHPNRRYQLADARDLSEYSTFDLAICRDAIQHVPIRDGARMIREIREHSRWMLVSTYILTDNRDVAEGEFYSPNLTAEPFDMPMPELLIFDGWDYGDGNRVRDPQKFLGLWRND